MTNFAKFETDRSKSLGMFSEQTNKVSPLYTSKCIENFK